MDQSTAQTIQLIDMEDKTQRLIHVLKCVSKGLSDINTTVSIAISALSTLSNVSTITQELQRQIQDVVEEFESVKQAQPQVSGQSLNSYVSQASSPLYRSSLEGSHHDQAHISSKSNHFKKSTQSKKQFYPQTKKSNAEHLKRPYYPKSELHRESSKDVGQCLSLDNKISSAYQTPIRSIDENTFKPRKNQHYRPYAFSFQKGQTDQLLKSSNYENKKDTKIYGPLQAVKQFPIKLHLLCLNDVIYERESLPSGQYVDQVQKFITFSEHILQWLNTTHGVLSTEIEIVAYIQSKASRLSNQTLDKYNKLRLSELKSRFQRFLKSRFDKAN